MSLNKRDIFAALKTLLEEITEVKTVVRVFDPIDIKLRFTTELPLIEIQEPDETVDKSMTSRRSIMSLATQLRVFFVRWGDVPNNDYENLEKVIRNKIGDNFCIENTAIATFVTKVSKVAGPMPLYQFTIGLRMLYYINETQT